jgi:hypothetical protein
MTWLEERKWRSQKLNASSVVNSLTAPNWTTVLDEKGQPTRKLLRTEYAGLKLEKQSSK